jgi:hypothetical protein
VVHSSIGFCNLRLRKLAGLIELNPHVDGSCILRFDKQTTTEFTKHSDNDSTKTLNAPEDRKESFNRPVDRC